MQDDSSIKPLGSSWRLVRMSLASSELSVAFPSSLSESVPPCLFTFFLTMILSSTSVSLLPCAFFTFLVVSSTVITLLVVVFLSLVDLTDIFLFISTFVISLSADELVVVAVGVLLRDSLE